MGGGVYPPPMAMAMDNAPVEDVSLVQEALAGNQLSFQLLVERYLKTKRDKLGHLLGSFEEEPGEG